MITRHEFDDYCILIGTDALSIFDYYNVDEMHGLSREGAVKRIAEGGTYIDGWVNLGPGDKPYLFLNQAAFLYNYKDITLVMHEYCHMALLLNDYDIESKEEQIITFAENSTNLFFENLYQLYNKSFVYL
jgi:hypothetical protein